MSWRDGEITVRERDALLSKIEAGTVAVLRVPPRAYANCWHAIPRGERGAARRKARLSDRHAFVACRAVLRNFLGSLLDCDPASVPISVSANGRPEVAGCGFSFSISHARGMSLVALATGRPVGVDVECPGRERDPLLIAEQGLPPAGRELVLAAPRAERTEVFLREWTKTEAVAKATGRGLVFPADEQVPRHQGVIARTIEVGDPWVAAVAVGPASRAARSRDRFRVSVR